MWLGVAVPLIMSWLRLCILVYRGESILIIAQQWMNLACNAQNMGNVCIFAQLFY